MADQIGQLRCLTRIGQSQHRVAGHDHAQIAMAGLGRVHEMRRRAGGGEGRRDLARDMAGFAHAADDHPPAHRRQRRHGLRERPIQRIRQLGQPGAFGPQHGAAGVQIVVRQMGHSFRSGGQGHCRTIRGKHVQRGWPS